MKFVPAFIVFIIIRLSLLPIFTPRSSITYSFIASYDESINGMEGIKKYNDRNTMINTNKLIFEKILLCITIGAISKNNTKKIKIMTIQNINNYLLQTKISILI